MLLDWLVFWDGGFQSVCPPMEKDKRLAQASWWGDWLRGKLGLVLYMFSKSSVQFSVDGWSCVLSLLLTWDQTMVEVIKIMVTSLKRSQACTTTVRAPNPAAGHHWPMPSPETPGHPEASLLWGHCSFLLGLSAQGSVVSSKSLFPCLKYQL